MDKKTRKLCERALATDPTLKTPTGKTGIDLMVVIRQIIARRMLENDSSQIRAGKSLSIQQRTLGRYLHGQGMRINRLSLILAEMGLSVTQFFGEHPLFGGKPLSRAKGIGGQGRGIESQRGNGPSEPVERVLTS